MYGDAYRVLELEETDSLPLPVLRMGGKKGARPQDMSRVRIQAAAEDEGAGRDSHEGGRGTGEEERRKLGTGES